MRLRQSQAAHSVPPRKYVQPSPQVRATFPASTCNRPCKYVRPSPQVRASEMGPELRQLGYKKARRLHANVSLVAFGLYLR